MLERPSCQMRLTLRCGSVMEGDGLERHVGDQRRLPDIPGGDKDGLLALLAGDAVDGKLRDVVAAVGVDLRKLGGRGGETKLKNQNHGQQQDTTGQRVTRVGAPREGQRCRRVSAAGGSA
ncbi:hypothetical protein chiPu_0031853, partial [Chiloscyllium punctatum]|nr:hypothetical protein [Chiloscyllium punctatum]